MCLSKSSGNELWKFTVKMVENQTNLCRFSNRDYAVFLTSLIQLIWVWKYHSSYQNFHLQEYLTLSHHLIFDYLDFDFENVLQLNYADCFSCVVVTLKMFQNFSFFLIQWRPPILMISLSVVSINSCWQSDPAACTWLYENGADHVIVEKDNWRMQILIKRQRLIRVTKKKSKD